MISFLCIPSFNSCLFDSSSFPATRCASALFHRTFCVLGLLRLLNSHMTSPGTFLVMDMKKTSSWEGFPMDMKLVNRAGG